MEIFAILLAVLMIAAALVATILIGMFAGGIWGLLVFATLVIGIYRLTKNDGDASMQSETLNAFQQPLADE